MMSMREDGAELDKIILTKDESFVPKGVGPNETVYKPAKLTQKNTYLDIDNYRYLLNSADHFEYQGLGEGSYYRDNKQSVLAIAASNVPLKHEFVSAKYQITKKKAKEFSVKLVTLTEINGESEYRVLINDKLIGEFKNPKTKVNHKEIIFDLGLIKFEQGDVITVQSNSATNGNVSEGGKRIFSSGKWRGLVLQHP
mgnify:CR=1 FL=1